MVGRDRFEGEFEAVLAGAQRGEPWALERIYEALSPVVAGYARLQGSQEPDDLTSEVFVGVLRNVGSFQGNESQFRSWVFTIAHRRLTDERRRAASRPRSVALADGIEPEAPDDVEQQVAAVVSVEELEALCNRLAPDQRDVMLLRLLGQLSVDEVAAALDKTPGAVRSLQHRGFLAIGRLVDQEGVIL
jgi:RNA polymerase sigma factor (sigma-70 family)